MSSPFKFRVAPEVRRSAYYLLASAAPLVAVGFGVSSFAGSVTREAVGFSVLVLAACVAMIVALRWNLRIDDQGVARRLLFRWDLWPWSVSRQIIVALHGLPPAKAGDKLIRINYGCRRKATAHGVCLLLYRLVTHSSKFISAKTAAVVAAWSAGSRFTSRAASPVSSRALADSGAAAKSARCSA